MNQQEIYEAIKPTRKISRYDGDNWFEKWANFSPRGMIASLSFGYLNVLGGVIKWCLANPI